jgi:hypothetical protein
MVIEGGAHDNNNYSRKELSNISIVGALGRNLSLSRSLFLPSAHLLSLIDTPIYELRGSIGSAALFFEVGRF